MIKRIKYIISLLILSFLFATPVKAIMMDLQLSGESEVKVGETITLKAEYVTTNDMIDPTNPDGDGDTTIEDVTNQATWTSSNESAATVSNTGVVTGVAAGTTTITASYGDRTDSKTIIVTAATNTSTSFYIADNLEMPGKTTKVGNTESVTINISGIPITEKKNIKASIDDETVAKVSFIDLANYDDHSMDNMVVVYFDVLKTGDATLTVSLNYNNQNYSDTFLISPTTSNKNMIIEYNNNENLPIKLEKGKTLSLKTFIKDNNNTNSEKVDVTNDAEWISLDRTKATVTKGNIEGLKTGKVVITVSYNTGEEVISRAIQLEIIEEATPSPEPTQKDTVDTPNSNKSVDPVVETKNICKKVDGVYYGKNGEVITEKEFSDNCNPKTGTFLNIVTIISLLLFLASLYVYLKFNSRKIYKV